MSGAGWRATGAHFLVLVLLGEHAGERNNGVDLGRDLVAERRLLLDAPAAAVPRRHHRSPPVHLLRDELRQLEALIVGEGIHLAGLAHGEEPGAARRDVPLCAHASAPSVTSQRRWVAG